MSVPKPDRAAVVRGIAGWDVVWVVPLVTGAAGQAVQLAEAQPQIPRWSAKSFRRGGGASVESAQFPGRTEDFMEAPSRSDQETAAGHRITAVSDRWVEINKSERIFL